MSKSEEKAKLQEELKAAFTKNVTLEGNVGKPTEDFYKSVLPEDLPIETVERVSQFNTAFIAAGASAFGEMSVAAMKKNKSLEETELVVPMVGKDNVSYSVVRRRENINPQDPKGDPIVKYGVVTTKYEVHGGVNAGELKKARTSVMELAAEALKK